MNNKKTEYYKSGKFRNCRKEFRCNETDGGRCKNIIKPGDKYFDTGEHNIDIAGGFGTLRFCMECANK